MSDQIKSRLEDEGTIAIAIEEDDVQALWVRVGPVYFNHEIYDEPGIWIEYQERYMDSDLRGPVLISAETWDELDKYVRRRLAKFDKSKYGVKVKR